jgi:hypothetical protein
VIEHARLAVANYGEGVITTKNDAGGIIKADNSFFYNNARGVGFAPYSNKYSSGKIYDDSSYVKGCTFEINNSYRGDATGYYFQSHIPMSNVSGIYILGDTFRNVSTQINTKNTGNAITTWSSGFNVIPYCPSPGCAISAYKHNVFEGFNIAINSNDGGLNPLNYCFVDYADFKDNGVGIYAKYNSLANIFHSTYKLDTTGGRYAPSCNCQKGIYLRQSPQFRIEENTFTAYKSKKPGPYVLAIILPKTWTAA